MFSVSFQTSSLAVLQIFLLGAVGYVLARRGVLAGDGFKILSFLLINIFFPSFTFYRLTHYFDFKTMPLWWALPLVNIGVIAAGYFLSSLLLIKRKVPYKNEFRAVLAFQNSGYIPLLMASTLPLGEKSGVLSTYILVSLVGYDILLWSLAVWLLRRAKNENGFALKQLINPPLIALFSALGLVALGWQQALPEDLLKPIKMLGDCAMPIAMIVIGGRLALTNLGRVSWPDMAVVCVGKLIIMPILGLIVVGLLKPEALLGLLIVMQTAVPTAVTLSIIGQHYENRQVEFLNQSIFFTHLLSILTLPIFLALLGYLALGY